MVETENVWRKVVTLKYGEDCHGLAPCLRRIRWQALVWDRALPYLFGMIGGPMEVL